MNLIVREVEERLPNHYLGPETFTHELAEYQPPRPPATSPPVAASPAPSGTTVATPQVAAGTHKVPYRVKGTAEEVMLTYRNAQGETEQTTIKIPIDSAWSVSFDASRGRFLYVAAQNARDTGSVSCEIWRDGRMMAQVSGTGAYVTVSCSDTAEQ